MSLAEDIVNQVEEHWWKTSSKQTFIEVAERLLVEFSATEVEQMLRQLHEAVSEEYGD